NANRIRLLGIADQAKEDVRHPLILGRRKPADRKGASELPVALRQRDQWRHGAWIADALEGVSDRPPLAARLAGAVDDGRRECVVGPKPDERIQPEAHRLD